MNSIHKTVVVPLDPKTDATMLLRQLRPIVNPGDRIELLVSYRGKMMLWFCAHVALLQTGCDGAVRCEERRTMSLRADLVDRMEREIAVPARRMFSGINVHVNLSLYSGSLRHRFHRYLETGGMAVLVGGSSRLSWANFIPNKLHSWLCCNTEELRVVLVQSARPAL